MILHKARNSRAFFVESGVAGLGDLSVFMPCVLSRGKRQPVV